MRNVVRVFGGKMARNDSRSPTGRPPCPKLCTPRPNGAATMRWGIRPCCWEPDLDCVPVRAGIRLHGDGVRAMRPLGSGLHPQQPCICRESWHGHGFASGLFAATVRPDKFPRPAVFLAKQISRSSRSFTALRPHVRCSAPGPAPIGSRQGRNGCDLVNF